MNKRGSNPLEKSITGVTEDKDGNPVIHVDADKLKESMMDQDYDQKELERAQLVISDLLEAHWRGIMGVVGRSDDSTASVSLSLKLDHSGLERELKAKIAYSVKTSDEVETTVRDPRQPEFGL